MSFQINVTLYDFGMSATNRLYGLVDSCFRYAVIKEKGTRDHPICGGKDREKGVYLSKSNIIEILIVSPEVFGQRGQFMFYYEGKQSMFLYILDSHFGCLFVFGLSYFSRERKIPECIL